MQTNENASTKPAPRQKKSTKKTRIINLMSVYLYTAAVGCARTCGIIFWYAVHNRSIFSMSNTHSYPFYWFSFFLNWLQISYKKVFFLRKTPLTALLDKKDAIEMIYGRGKCYGNFDVHIKWLRSFHLLPYTWQ